MSGTKNKKKSIDEVFNDMDYAEKLEKHKFEGFVNFHHEMEGLSELVKALKITKEPKPFDVAVEAAVKAQHKWKNSSALKRANSVHKYGIWKDLKEISKPFTKLKNDFSAMVDYFDFYSDLIIQTEEYKNWRPHGVVCIILPDYSPFFLLGAIIPAALGTGCSAIVLAPEGRQIMALFLEEIIAQIGLPEGLFNVVTDYDPKDIPVSKKISKVFFCGFYSAAQRLYTKSLARSLNIICPKNTTAFILESCDLDAAVDKIITKTWGKNPFFAVANVVIQESIYKIFLQKLKYKIEQFMIENINDLKFKDAKISVKITEEILKALKAGALIEKCTKYENETEWSPTVIVNYQNQNIEDDLPILRVSVCRTAKEGVTLVNNCRFGFGTSIWTEISPQALEISSLLVSPNIWVNCHGVFDAGEPLQTCGFSGNCIIGGNDGILEFMSFRLDDATEGYKSSEDKTVNFCQVVKMHTLQMADSAQKAYSVWQNVKCRREYLKHIANSLEDNKELSKLSEMISNYAHYANIINFSERNSTQEVLVIRRKIPVGVILLIVNTTSIDIKLIASLITPAIVLGNAVIVVLKDDNSSVKLLIRNFRNFLPENLLNVIVGIEGGIHLASDPNIQAIWLYEESEVSAELLQTIKSHSSRSLKHIWIIPKSISISQNLFQKECLKNKVIWLTKVDHFP